MTHSSLLVAQGRAGIPGSLSLRSFDVTPTPESGSRLPQLLTLILRSVPFETASTASALTQANDASRPLFRTTVDTLWFPPSRTTAGEPPAVPSTQARPSAAMTLVGVNPPGSPYAGREFAPSRSWWS